MAKMKDFMVKVDPNKVLYTNISTSKDGYNSARIVVKAEDKEYLSISYEWEGGNIPGFAMDLMEFMKNSGMETSGVWPAQEAAYEEFSAKCKKPMKDDEEDMEDMEDEEDMDKKKTGKKKKKC